MRKILNSLPQINSNDINEVVKVLRSGQLSQGEKTAAFEKAFAKYIGTKYAVATANGTTALHLALLALNIKPGDEIITTAFSFIASTNAIFYVGAKPIFVDIATDFNIDPAKIEEKIGPKTKAILVVHLYGQPAAMEKILAIAKKHKLKVIEDCAQAHGAEFANKKVGSLGEVGCFSFYPTKNITTLEGGMITTNKLLIAKKLKLLRNHGSEKKYYHQELGYNFRLNEVQAVLGMSQLRRLKKINTLRRRNAKLYYRLLSNNTKINLPQESPGTKSVYHQFTILTSKRNLLQKKLQKKGITTGIHYPLPIHQQPFIKKLFPRISLPKTEKCSASVLSLPVHPGLSISQINYICDEINKITKDF